MNHEVFVDWEKRRWLNHKHFRPRIFGAPSAAHSASLVKGHHTNKQQALGGGMPKFQMLIIYCCLIHTLHRDLAIKHMFDSHPVLWHCLLLLSDSTLTTNSANATNNSLNSVGSCYEPSALVMCAPVVRSLLTVLTQHWQRCCVEGTDMFRRELGHSIFIVECMARVSCKHGMA